MNSYPTQTTPPPPHHRTRLRARGPDPRRRPRALPRARCTVARAVANLPLSAVAVVWGRAHGGACVIHDDLLITCAVDGLRLHRRGHDRGQRLALRRPSTARTGTATRRATRTSGPLLGAVASRSCTARSSCAHRRPPAERVRGVGRPARRWLPARPVTRAAARNTRAGSAKADPALGAACGAVGRSSPRAVSGRSGVGACARYQATAHAVRL